MNWRRGLLLAGINLAVALPMILMMEVMDQKYSLTQEEIMAKSAIADPPKPPELPMTEPRQGSPEPAEQTVSFDLCKMWVHYPAKVVVLQGADLPSLLLAGWEDDCPARWTLAGRIRGKTTGRPTPLWMERQREIDAGLCLLIAVQWFLIGAFPFARTQKWWADPGSFITVCAVLAGAFALIPTVDGFARLPASIAMLAWFWWFGFLVWRALQISWRMTIGNRIARSI